MTPVEASGRQQKPECQAFASSLLAPRLRSSSVTSTAPAKVTAQNKQKLTPNWVGGPCAVVPHQAEGGPVRTSSAKAGRGPRSSGEGKEVESPTIGHVPRPEHNVGLHSINSPKAGTGKMSAIPENHRHPQTCSSLERAEKSQHKSYL